MAVNPFDKLKMMIMGPKGAIQKPGKKMDPKMVMKPKAKSQKAKTPKPPPNPYMKNGGL